MAVTVLSEDDIRFLYEYCPLDTGVQLDAVALSDYELLILLLLWMLCTGWLSRFLVMMLIIYRLNFMLWAVLWTVSYTWKWVLDRLQRALQKDIDDANKERPPAVLGIVQEDIVDIFTYKAAQDPQVNSNSDYIDAQKMHLEYSERLLSILEKVRFTFGLADFTLSSLGVEDEDNLFFAKMVILANFLTTLFLYFLTKANPQSFSAF